MKLDDIFQEWEKDSEIDITDLGHASLQEAKLHSKYIRILANESLLLKKLEAAARELTLAKTRFYLHGPSKETVELGWVVPDIGKIIKSDLQVYMQADPDIIKSELHINVQKQKVEALDSIIKTIQRRSFQIKNAIDYMKFQNGA